MKKLMIAAVAATLLITPASATQNFGMSTVPSLMEIVEGYKEGKYQRYPGVVRETESGLRIGPSGGYLFADHLKPGTILPRIVDAQALLRAAKMKQTVEVASLSRVYIKFPVIAEIAEQNKVSYAYLMGYLLDNAYEDERGDTIRSIHDTAVYAASVANQLIAEQVNEEVAEVVAPVIEEVVEEVEEEVHQTLQELYNSYFDRGLNADDFVVDYPEHEGIVGELEAGDYAG